MPSLFLGLPIDSTDLSWSIHRRAQAMAVTESSNLRIFFSQGCSCSSALFSFTRQTWMSWSRAPVKKYWSSCVKLPVQMIRLWKGLLLEIRLNNRAWKSKSEQSDWKWNRTVKIDGLGSSISNNDQDRSRETERRYRPLLEKTRRTTVSWWTARRTISFHVLVFQSMIVASVACVALIEREVCSLNSREIDSLWTLIEI